MSADQGKQKKMHTDILRYFWKLQSKIEDPFPSTNKAYCTYITPCGCATVWHWAPQVCSYANPQNNNPVVSLKIPNGKPYKFAREWTNTTNQKKKKLKTGQ